MSDNKNINALSKNFHTKLRNTLNSLKTESKWICNKKHPCKRKQCAPCMYRRKQYFLTQAVPFVDKCSLSQMITVSLKGYWQHHTPEELSEHLRHLRSYFTSLKKNKINKYILVLSLGKEKCTPHFHVILNKNDLNNVLPILESNKELDIHHESINEPHGIISYIFRNFECIFNHPAYPKRFRALSGSRDIKYGFPPIEFDRSEFEDNQNDFAVKNLIANEYNKGLST